MDWIYIIVPTSEVTDEMLANGNVNNPRKTVKGTSKTLLKYIGSKPSCFSSYNSHTEAEIKVILNDVNGDWYGGDI